MTALDVLALAARTACLAVAITASIAITGRVLIGCTWMLAPMGRLCPEADVSTKTLATAAVPWAIWIMTGGAP